MQTTSSTGRRPLEIDTDSDVSRDVKAMSLDELRRLRRQLADHMEREQQLRADEQMARDLIEDEMRTTYMAPRGFSSSRKHDVASEDSRLARLLAASVLDEERNPPCIDLTADVGVNNSFLLDDEELALAIQSQETSHSRGRSHHHDHSFLLTQRPRERQPDVDNMTYEQLLELGERLGQVSRGASREDINSLPTIQHTLETQNCSVCLDDIHAGEKVKILPCLHRYHDNCIDSWLKMSRKCPVCHKEIAT
ncbi:hypothetical protein PROFUN_13590 [Planoprotostelium fungivorum]|uniref:RING-type domain-containing protein n=1 Tax=Planoprotostelium fungivorum TaxID=1890364 RepID=A0A2P6N3M6_9EUKA|nr:hypothetical protein PROFUN_13590 [Planoprotostelium fungivorum]